MQKRLSQTLGVALLAGSMALSFSATAAEGLYSSRNLMDANVFDTNGEDVGDVQDILMGDDMALHSLVIRTGSVLGLGGREIVAERGSFTVKPQEPQDDPENVSYEVHVEASQDAMKQFPEYDQGWWNQTRESAAQAWENTKDVSANAWESTKQATETAWENIRGGAENLGDKAREATGN